MREMSITAHEREGDEHKGGRIVVGIITLAKAKQLTGLRKFGFPCHYLV